MRNFIDKWGMVVGSALAGLVVSLTIVRCGSDATPSYVQVERLGRPGINEALVVTPSYLAAFNGIGPALDLTAPASQVVAEAKAVLGALYLGACFASGALGLTDPDDANTPKPGGIACKDASGNSLLVAANIFNGGNITAGVKTAAQTKATEYADKMGGYFLPDVLRIDTTVNPSGYANSLCATAAAGKPLLCGGRAPDDDVIDVTYGFLLGGDASAAIAGGVLKDGVSYGGGVGAQNQGHRQLRTSFPWIPRPNDTQSPITP